MHCSLFSVRVLDMLRFSKFTIGHAWMPEYGDAQKPEHLEFLLRYSPVHVAPDSAGLAAATERLRNYLRERGVHYAEGQSEKAHGTHCSDPVTLSAQYPALLLLTGDHDDRVVRIHLGASTILYCGSFVICTSIFTKIIHYSLMEETNGWFVGVCRCLSIATSLSPRFSIVLGTYLSRYCIVYTVYSLISINNNETKLTKNYSMWYSCLQKNPLLIRVDTKSGHGMGKPTTKIVCNADLF